MSKNGFKNVPCYMRITCNCDVCSENINMSPKGRKTKKLKSTLKSKLLVVSYKIQIDDIGSAHNVGRLMWPQRLSKTFGNIGPKIKSLIISSLSVSKILRLFTGGQLIQPLYTSVTSMVSAMFCVVNTLIQFVHNARFSSVCYYQ